MKDLKYKAIFVLSATSANLEYLHDDFSMLELNRDSDFVEFKSISRYNDMYSIKVFFQPKYYLKFFSFNQSSDDAVKKNFIVKEKEEINETRHFLFTHFYKIFNYEYSIAEINSVSKEELMQDLKEIQEII